ncbi:DUF503 domain-containing protein [Candidatus Neomarinimicrobiota bacterium]
MHIALLRARIDIPQAMSLKDKRRVVKSIKDRVSGKMNVSVAEVGDHDIWNRAELAFVTVANESKVVDKRISGLTALLDSGHDWQLLELVTERL